VPAQEFVPRCPPLRRADPSEGGEDTHLIEVGLQGLVLRTLLGKLSLGLGALVLDLLRLLGALILNPLLTRFLLSGEPEPRYSENERKAQGTKKLQPLP
jgi:hypothetical protein